MFGTVDMANNAAGAASQAFATPQMVAERATGTQVPEGACAYFQPMLREAMATVKVEMRQEIGAEVDRSMAVNFNSLNAAME